MQSTKPNQPARISVVRDKHLVPLLTSATAHHATTQPWSGVLLEHHHVRASEIPEHEHPDLCLHLQSAGSDDFEWWSDGRNAVERTRPGSLILLPPGTSDRLHWKGNSERIIISVRQEYLLEQARSAGLKSLPSFAAKWALSDPALQNIVTEMGREARGEWQLGSLYADLLALGLQTHLLRNHLDASFVLPHAKGGLALPKLRRAMEFINASVADDVRLEAIAETVELSPSHFAHEFRGSTGQTPYQYLLDQRMARARELLRTTVWTVQQIGAAVGFNSAVNFVRAFRQRVGCTPAAWRAGN